MIGFVIRYFRRRKMDRIMDQILAQYESESARRNQYVKR